MIAIGLFFGFIALGFLCWLLFNLAVYALPCLLGISAAIWSFHHGSGYLGALAVAFLSGAASLALGQLAFAHLRSPQARLGTALLFAGPAAAAGFYAALGLARDIGSGPYWSEAFAVVGAALVGGTAFVRIAAVPVSRQHPDRTANDNFAAAGRL
jgi:hypothetical protein